MFCITRIAYFPGEKLNLKMFLCNLGQDSRIFSKEFYKHKEKISKGLK